MRAMSFMRGRFTAAEGGTHSIVTVPNILSCARLVMALIAAALFVAARFERVAVVGCVAGVILDAVDGWYARRFGQCTQLGRFLDPLADKVLMGVIYGVVAMNAGSIIVWVLVGTVMVRDLAVTASRLRAYRRLGATYAASALGKVKMFVQSVGGIAILAGTYVVPGVHKSMPYFVAFVMLVVTILSCLSAARYLAPAAPPKRKGGCRRPGTNPLWLPPRKWIGW
jgi:CDP-diacylglycerol--glycerol-3-phosphate 3-phosphatidyltransferase